MKKIFLSSIAMMLTILAFGQVSFDIDDNKITTGLLFAKDKSSKEYTKYLDESTFCLQNNDWYQKYSYINLLNAKELITMEKPSHIFAHRREITTQQNIAHLLVFDYGYNLVSDGAFVSNDLCFNTATTSIVDQTNGSSTPLSVESVMVPGIIFPIQDDVQDHITIKFDPSNLYSNAPDPIQSIELIANGQSLATWDNSRINNTVDVKDIMDTDLIISVKRRGITKSFCYKANNDVFKRGIGELTDWNYEFSVLGKDDDGDGIRNVDDNCPQIYNPQQYDIDGDGIGDACDDDIDGDGFLNHEDNCPLAYNPSQIDSDNDGKGDACDGLDTDKDCVNDDVDNCPFTFNPLQGDLDNDGIGDACDDDIDGDNITNDVDNCPETSNTDQSDIDGDGIGDVCDTDMDDDGVPNDEDNCVDTPNPAQIDEDFDGIGTLCDPNENPTGCQIFPDKTINITASQGLDLGFYPFSTGEVTINYSTPAQITDYLLNMSQYGVSGLVGPSKGSAKVSFYINPLHESVKKPIIISDGIDLFNNRPASQIKALFGGNESLRSIWDNGYDLIIVDYDYGSDFIEKNAYVMQEVIRHLINVEKVDEIPMIVGPSMGGLVVSYALLDWEENIESSEGEHLVKTFLSGDVPWKGANVTPAVGGLASQFSFIDIFTAQIYNRINSPAARQMVLNEFSTNHFPSSTIIYAPDHHYLFDQFYDKLNEKGPLPAGTDKNLAIVAGALTNSGSNLAPAGSDIIVAKIDLPGIMWDGSLSLKSIKDNSFTLHSQGTVNFIKDVLVTTGSNEYDSNKGSSFDLRSYFPNDVFITKSALGIELKLSVTLENDLTFVPTFSALAANTTDPTVDFSGSPDGLGGLVIGASLFDFVFADDINSAHVGFTNNTVNGVGTDFHWALAHLGGTAGSLSDQCDVLVNDIIKENSITVSSTDIINVQYADDMFIYPFSNYNLTITKIAGNIDLYNSIQPCGPSLVIPACETDGYVLYEFCIDLKVGDCEKSMCETLSITVEEDEDCTFMFAGNNDKTQSTLGQSFKETEKFKAYPNPGFGSFQLTNSESGILTMIDMQGRVVYQQTIDVSAKIDVDLPPNMYVVKFTSQSTGKDEIIRLVIQ